MATPVPNNGTILSNPSGASPNGNPLNANGRPSGCLIPYVDPASATGEVKQTLDSMPFVRNIFLLLGHSPGLFPPLMKVYQAAFNGQKRSLPVLDWQLVVLRTAARLDAPYPWDVNEPVARINGMNKAKLDSMGAPPEAVQSDSTGVWTARDKVIVKLVDEQLKTYSNEPATVAKARELLSEAELVEIYIILGVYALIARITRGLKIDLDGDIPGLEDSLRKMITK
jgi:hypothetical protein